MANKPLLGPRKAKDEKKLHWQGSSEHLKKALDLTKIVSFRLQMIVLAVCVTMSLIVFRLYSIQMLNTDSYESKLESYTRRYQTVTTPRGEMLDRNGQVLVGNKPRQNITYFPPQDITDSKEWELARLFSQYFEVDEAQLRTRDLKDLYLSLHNAEVQKQRISQEEMDRYKAGELDDADIYYLKLERIVQEDLNTLDTDLRKAFVIKQAMDMPSSGQTKIIKSDVTIEEAAYLIEHSEDYQGFTVDIDWDREYPFNSMIKQVLGTVTTSKQGLPAEDLEYYLALDYSRNEKVGKSGLEKQYESLLSGKRSVYDLKYDENGSGYLNEVEEGGKGYDLELSYDATIQQKLDSLLSQYLTDYKDDPLRPYMSTILYTVMDPNTGDVLAMSGMVKNTDGTISSNPVAVYTDAYPSGSSVKGATVYMALDSGVMAQGEKIVDGYIKIKDTPIKKSWKALGLVDDVQALAQSSNVYMFNVAIRMGGGNYVENGSLNLNKNAFETMRQYYTMFGLGVKTGIDVPNETVGYIGEAQNAGNMLDFAIGQYDNYTNIELAQYVSTIANGGKRIQPRLVRKAYEPATQEVVYENPVQILNTLDNKAAISRVQQGFNACVMGGICYGMNDVPVSLAAKTGTAEDFYTTTDENGQTIRVDTTNNTLVAYAPFEKPKYAIACTIPNAWNVSTSGSQTNLCLKITNDLLSYIYNPLGQTVNPTPSTQPFDSTTPILAPTSSPVITPTPTTTP